MRKIYTFSLSLVMLFLALNVLRAQPAYYTSTYSGGCNSWPLSASTSSGSNKCQWLILPGAISGAPAGMIANVYVYPCSTPATSWTNLIVRLGLTSITTLPGGSWITSGMTTCLSASSYTAVYSGGWLKFVLTTPFTYNPSPGLIFELEQDGYSSSGVTINQNTMSYTGRMYGSTLNSSCSGSVPATTDFGIDVTAGYYNDAGISAINHPLTLMAGTDSVTATITDYGKKTLTSVSVRYSVDGVLQTPAYNWTGSLASAASIPVPVKIGTYTFTSGTHIIKAWTQFPNGVSDSNHTNDTTTKTLCTGLGGNYTIGTGGNYSSFGAAIAALTTCGIYAPVNFTVNSGTYSERVIIPAIPGASATNTVTFSGVNKTAAVLSYTSSSTTNLSTLVLNGASYVRFNNMTIQNLGTSYGRAIFFTNNANYDKISNCMIIVNSASTSSYLIGIEAGSY